MTDYIVLQVKHSPPVQTWVVSPTKTHIPRSGSPLGSPLPLPPQKSKQRSVQTKGVLLRKLHGVHLIWVLGAPRGGLGVEAPELAAAVHGGAQEACGHGR